MWREKTARISMTSMRSELNKKYIPILENNAIVLESIVLFQSFIVSLSLSDFLWFFPSFIGTIYFCGIYRKPGRAELNRIHVISKNIWNVESTGIFILFDRRNNFLPRFYLV